MVTVFVPMSSGMLAAVHVSVPVAVPEAPVEVDHTTELTPTLSEAMPWKVMLLAVVETMVDAGFVMVSEGGVVSCGEPVCGVEGGLGDEGELGPEGELGDDGFDGVLGEDGELGAFGEDGVFGVEGETGLPGAEAGACSMTEMVCVTM